MAHKIVQILGKFITFLRVANCIGGQNVGMFSLLANSFVHVQFGLAFIFSSSVTIT